MDNITITISADGQKATLKPAAQGYLLQRGLDSHLYPEAEVRNKASEIRRWKAVKV